jgi:hypothetical protein
MCECLLIIVMAKTVQIIDLIQALLFRGEWAVNRRESIR